MKCHKRLIHRAKLTQTRGTLTRTDMYCHTNGLTDLIDFSTITATWSPYALWRSHDGGGMAKESQSELMTAEETCRYLKITQRTLYRYLQNHQIPAFKLGKEWRFVRSDLEQWIRERTRRPLAS